MKIQTLSAAEKREYPVAVVGGGIAGYTAALALKNLNIGCIWLGRKPFGDKLLLAEYVRNFPALVGDGKTFAARLEEQAKEEGLVFTEARIDGIYAGDREFMLTENGETLSARAVILCTGVETAGSCKGEADFVGRGVSYCAVCDGALYRGKTIACVLSSKEFEAEAERSIWRALRNGCTPSASIRVLPSGRPILRSRRACRLPLKAICA